VDQNTLTDNELFYLSKEGKEHLEAVENKRAQIACDLNAAYFAAEAKYQLSIKEQDDAKEQVVLLTSQLEQVNKKATLLSHILQFISVMFAKIKNAFEHVPSLKAMCSTAVVVPATGEIILSPITESSEVLGLCGTILLLHDKFLRPQMTMFVDCYIDLNKLKYSAVKKIIYLKFLEITIQLLNYGVQQV